MPMMNHNLTNILKRGEQGLCAEQIPQVSPAASQPAPLLCSLLRADVQGRSPVDPPTTAPALTCPGRKRGEAPTGRTHLTLNVLADEVSDGHEGLGPVFICVPGTNFHRDSPVASNLPDILQAVGNTHTVILVTSTDMCWAWHWLPVASSSPHRAS
jgi:hypothetical protein